jgi:hypothetical protein
MNIAVIADTHGKLPEATHPALQTADEIWHLGDFCDASTLKAVRRLGPPVFAVLGNNDYGLDLPAQLTLERLGLTFRLLHIPPPHPSGVPFLLHGHTHVPRDEMVGGTRVLNPGTIGKPNKGAPPSWAWLRLEPGQSPIWEIIPVTAKKNGRW